MIRSTLRTVRTRVLAVAVVTGLALAVLPTPDVAHAAVKKQIVQTDPAGDTLGRNAPSVDLRSVSARRVGQRLEVKVRTGSINTDTAEGYWSIDFTVDGSAKANLYVYYHGTRNEQPHLQVGNVSRRCPKKLTYVPDYRTDTYTVTFPVSCLLTPPFRTSSFLQFKEVDSTGEGADGYSSRDFMTFSNPNRVLDIR